ncbi:MAG: sigma-54-dependent Fis family transcriptional regulator [Proteobacteria bacterium]|nr:MAG: sigma-54-dependent Fis family transcriptional regulator [Pseudomonadota bacterium]
MATHHALIVDDEPDIRELLAITLARMDIECTTAADVAAAKACLAERDFDICLTDMQLPDGNGLDLVAYIQKRKPNLPVAVITAHGSMELAIQALKSGAFDFVSKPLDVNDLRNLVAQAIKLGERIETTGKALIGQSANIEQLRATITKLARSQAPVYISGESGTGKELVARLIHAQGSRAGHDFVPVNCGAIPHELIESELFGHTKGSFTGATADKPGLFQSANGGTLFLDEVAELPVQMQVKLLRAIQEKRIRPVGAPQEIPVDCRILSATHKNLAELVADGSFRQDLYYRINVIELKVPALRERAADIDLMVDHFLEILSERAGMSRPVLSKRARVALRDYRFPGNVRELENILERAITLGEGDIIDVDDLNLPSNDPAAHSDRAVAEAGELQSYLDDVERARILQALEQTRWNKTKAAKLLGISFRALRYRLEKLELDNP